MSRKSRNITLNVPMIARLEGEGALELRARHGKLESVQLKIYEPPRFFEKFVEGKHYSELPHLVARICGICPIAYQMTAVRAVERIFEVQIPDEIQRLRRVTQCGEWLQSHALHIGYLAAPDHLGYNNILAMAGEHPKAVERVFRLQALGNALLSLQGARSVHPVGLRVGGFSSCPNVQSIQALLEQLEKGLDDVIELMHWIASFELPDAHSDFLQVSCCEPGCYPMNEGQIQCSDGSQIPPAQYKDHFTEQQYPGSTALYSFYQGDKAYLVGPLARVNLNYGKLEPQVRALASELGWLFPSTNMYHSIRARAMECFHVILEAKTLLCRGPYTRAMVPVHPKAGWAAHVTEAPRGLIYHHYRLDSQGCVEQACIIPPTSQNQARIEQDLRESVQDYGLDHSDRELQLFCERLIRNYDPCISCSVHFLDLRVDRG